MQRTGGCRAGCQEAHTARWFVRCESARLSSRPGGRGKHYTAPDLRLDGAARVGRRGQGHVGRSRSPATKLTLGRVQVYTSGDSPPGAVAFASRIRVHGRSTLPNLRENRVKRKLQRGEVATVATGHTTPDVVEMVGLMGFDGVWIETEHGPVDFADIPDLTRAADLWGLTSVVRVNQNVPGIIYRTLDVGAQGVVVPHVNTADEARAVVDAGKFEPLGARGMYTSRQGWGVSNYVAQANDETLLVVLIEDIVAVNNLSEILKVDHIDVFFVAPGDLAQSMRLAGPVRPPQVQETIDGALAQIVAAGRVSGAVVTDANVEASLEKGVQFMLVGWQPWAASGASAFHDKVASARG